MVCPKCRADQAHRSHRRGLVEQLASLFAVYPYRCRACENRFLRFRYSAQELPPSGNPSAEREVRSTRSAIQWKRKRRELLLYGTCFLVFLAILYFIVRVPGVPSSENG